MNSEDDYSSSNSFVEEDVDQVDEFDQNAKLNSPTKSIASVDKSEEDDITDEDASDSENGEKDSGESSESGSDYDDRRSTISGASSYSSMKRKDLPQKVHKETKKIIKIEEKQITSYVPDEERQARPIMSANCLTAVVSTRANQLAHSGKHNSTLVYEHIINLGYDEIPLEELNQGKSPVRYVIKMPNGKYEYWDPKETYIPRLDYHGSEYLAT